MTNEEYGAHRPASEDGYELWLRYPRIQDDKLAQSYQYLLGIELAGDSPSLAAARAELVLALSRLLGRAPTFLTSPEGPRLIVGTPDSHPVIGAHAEQLQLQSLGAEGFAIAHVSVNRAPCTIVAARSDIGVLYGVFALLARMSQTLPLEELPQSSTPRIARRILNHWDNLDRTIERGYAGFSLWDWHKLPDYADPRLVDYARANAAIGINGAVLTNVNANALVLTAAYLQKVRKLAEVFRPYGLRVYLTARFSAPVELGELKTSDPLDAAVADWWQRKAAEIYALIPDFGGFLVKANSEGQPGPQNYGRDHADGANLLAQALAPHGGIVIWRAFVYDSAVPVDRHKQANLEFEPLDGRFLPNACVQVKNGAIDFQPREPFHPLFGRMPKTPLMLELQLTQEYLGHGTHLVYLGPLFEEVLRADTFAQGTDSTVARVTDGSLHGHALSGIAAVTNIGGDCNWCGHPFAAANWYAFGRLSWDHQLSSAQIAEEYLTLGWSRDPIFLEQMTRLLMASREACVNYMTPLGLHHLMAWDHHCGPGPWIDQGRPDWTAIYYHRADADGIGFDRTATGSNALEQYFPEARAQFASMQSCPEPFLLWFHHVPWDHRMASGLGLWDELCLRYQQGVDQVRQMQATWAALETQVDPYRFAQVTEYLKIQEKEARFWRDSCVLYFQTFSKRPIPKGVEPAEHPLEYYRNFTLYYVPGIPERRFR